MTNSSQKPKLSSLHLLLNQELYDVIFVTETWLSKKVTNALLLGSSNYEVFRCDRVGKSGGGCAIFVLSPISARLVPSDGKTECCCIDVSHNNSSLRCAVFYRPPNSGRVGLSALCRQISQLRLSSENEFLCVGDGNAKSIDWVNHICNDPLETLLMETASSLNLTQVVTQPTRGQNILDIVLTSDSSLTCTVSEPFLFSDHNSIKIEIPFSVPRNEILTKKVRNYRKGDYERIQNEIISIDWHQTYVNCDNVETFWRLLHCFLMECVSKFVPMKTIATNAFLLPIGLRKLESRRSLMFNRYGPQSRHFKKAESHYARAMRKYVCSVEDDILRDGDKTRFYSFMKAKLKRKETIPDLVSHDSIASSDREKAVAFSKFFCSVYTRDNGILDHFPVRSPITFDGISFEPTHIRYALKMMKPKMSSGSDLLPAFFYKKLAKVIDTPLSLLFHFSYVTGVIPKRWKISTVVPIYKKGPKDLVNNYRPISKQATVLKIMEKVVIYQLTSYLNHLNLFSNAQYGFRPGLSVTKQLLTCLNHWTQDYRKGTDVVFLDFTKAFDTVSHQKVLHKLKAYGISGLLLQWFQSYLTDRHQRVQINDCYSEFTPITSGILQGSCAGPVLFLLFINDLPDILENVKVAMFADDVKLYSSNPENLQIALNKINTWCQSWQLSLAEQKCTYIRISPAEVLPPYPFRINNAVIEYTALQKDLGVLLSSDLNLHPHYSKLIKKANSASYHILKSFTSKRAKTMALAFSTYVRPILESFSPVWNPTRRQDVESIERVQRSFTRFVYFKCNLPEASYPERLSFLGLETLESRRQNLDLSFAHLLYHSDTELSRTLLIRHNPRRSLRSNHRLDPEPRPTGPRAAFFTNRIVQPWNSLQTELIPLSNVTFKKKLRNQLG